MESIMPESDAGELKPTDHAAHLITLFAHEDILINNWLKTLFAIESALGIGFIYLIKDFIPAPRHYPEWFIYVLSILIPVLGAIFSLTISSIIERELKWQNWYMHGYNQLCKWDQSVFPSGGKQRLEPRDQQAGYISSRIHRLCQILVVIWGVIGGLVVLAIAFSK
jgi:hypothetical protein